MRIYWRFEFLTKSFKNTSNLSLSKFGKTKEEQRQSHALCAVSPISKHISIARFVYILDMFCFHIFIHRMIDASHVDECTM